MLLLFIANGIPVDVENKEYESSSTRCKASSNVWDVFLKIAAEHDEDSEAICTFCLKVYSAKSSNGTSHLLRHMSSTPECDNGDVKYTTSHDTLTDASTSLGNREYDLGKMHLILMQRRSFLAMVHFLMWVVVLTL